MKPITAFHPGDIVAAHRARALSQVRTSVVLRRILRIIREQTASSGTFYLIGGFLMFTPELFAVESV
jgi:hypothetical protein